MKKLPLKWKLTILYTAFMTILTVVMLGVLLSLSSSEILSSVEQEMEDKVFGVSEDIQWTGKRLQLDRDFYEVENGIYLSAYNESGSLLGGRIPYEFTEDVPLEEGLRKISAGDIQWDIRDTALEVPGYGTVWVRGITSITDAESSLRITVRFSLVLFPLMVALAAVLGYLFVRRAFRPVARLTATAREIYEKEDLSKRIGLTGEKNEIYVMAETFDMMLDKLEASFEKEKRFTSDASHELRTPVTVILSQCDYLLEDRDLSEEERSAVEAIRRKARSMSKMISQLLFLSRADQGRQAVHKELLDLSLITEMAADEQEEMAAEKNISIVRDIGEGIEGYVDETLFIRVDESDRQRHFLWERRRLAESEPEKRKEHRLRRCGRQRDRNFTGTASAYLGTLLSGGYFQDRKRKRGFRTGPSYGKMDRGNPRRQDLCKEHAGGRQQIRVLSAA